MSGLTSRVFELFHVKSGTKEKNERIPLRTKFLGQTDTQKVCAAAKGGTILKEQFTFITTSLRLCHHTTLMSFLVPTVNIGHQSKCCLHLRGHIIMWLCH